MAQQQTNNAPRRPRDLNQWAKRMLDIGAGEVKDWAPSPDEGGQRPDHVPLFEEASYVRNTSFDVPANHAARMRFASR